NLKPLSQHKHWGCGYFLPTITLEEPSFFPFMFGIYPYTVVTEKQKQAMERANVNYVYMSVYEIVYAEVKKLLRA
ncbi:hypothetical protein AALB53_23225, partial [Lachnospiraceae bacterium 47-T17]